MTITVNRNLINCKKARKKGFRGFNGIRTRGVCDYRCDGHIPAHFICIPAVHIISFCVSFLSRVDELNKLAGHQCMALHSSPLVERCSANAEATGSNPVEAPKSRLFFFWLFRNCLHCDSLRWSHIHFICIPAVHIISKS